MNTILEQIIQKIAMKKSVADYIDTDLNANHISDEVISTDESLYRNDQLDQQSNNYICDAHGEMKATNSRFHCLPLDSYKTKEDNGVAVISPSVDITQDLISPVCYSSEEVNATNKINTDNMNELITTSENEICVDDISSLRLAIEAQNEQHGRLEQAIERLERTIERLAENCNMSSTQSRITAKRILQLDEQIPNKITIQYFLNSGRKVPPRVKLELRHKQIDRNGKPYYQVYQIIYGDCHKDFGRTKLDKFMGYSINYNYFSQIEPLQDFVHRMTRGLQSNTDCLGAFFYEKDTMEIFHRAYIIINTTKGLGNLFLYDGNDFAEEAFEFAESKAKDGSKSPDGIYTINQNKIIEMLGLDTAG